MRDDFYRHSGETDGDSGDRALWPALLRGWLRRCPRCGRGPLLRGYLKVRSGCSVCKLDYSHHRADDGPAYLTILLVGHLMAPLLHLVFVTWRPEPLILFSIFAVGCVGLSLYLLPRLKGLVVGFQWARAMGGFGPRNDARAPRSRHSGTDQDAREQSAD